MAKKHYFDFHGPKSVSDIAKLISAEISEGQQESSKEKLIHDIKNIEDCVDGDLAFISNKKYSNMLETSKCTACIVDKDFDATNVSKEIILVRAEDPYFAYCKAIKALYSEKTSISKSPISEQAKIGNNVSIGHNVVIEDETEIGDDCIIDHNVIIKYGSRIAKNTKIGAGSYIAYANIGANCIIHPGSRIGTDGFGFATNAGVHHKILHVGSVIIGDNVEVGANSTIDRGSNKDTIIGSGTIIDNLVQIGHNVEVGRGCVIVAQVGISGSTKLGNYVAVGGQAGLAGHIKIANFVQIAAKSGVMSDIETEKQIVGGFPSQPIRDWHKQTILLRKMLK